MPGRPATLRNCSSTLLSMSLISAASAKMTPGTRIAPLFGTCHSVSPICFNPLVSIGASYVDDALRNPAAIVALPDLQLGQGRALGLDGGRMTIAVDRFAPCFGAEPPIVDRNLVTPEQHAPHRHLVDQPVEPIVEQKQIRRRAAFQ